MPENEDLEPVVPETEILKCGIIMPLSPIDGCTAAHWEDVNQIITDAVREVGFDAEMVSAADEAGVIHKTIIENIYKNPIVVCDISCKNPNVMFELGMRLAFDKPTIIIKDDSTSSSFDTAPIEYLSYPRDLRFPVITEFKRKLGQKVLATFKKAKEDPNYTTFLKHFGSFKVTEIATEVVSKDDFIIEQIKLINDKIETLKPKMSASQPTKRDTGGFETLSVKITNVGVNNIKHLIRELEKSKATRSLRYEGDEDEFFLIAEYHSIIINREELKQLIKINLPELASVKFLL